jgi:signal peptide peptidase SppA
MSTPSRSYPRIQRFVTEHPWAILPSALDALCEVLESRLDGARLTAEQIEARIGPRGGEEPGRRMVGPVAVIPIQGILAHKMNLLTAMSGGMSAEMIAREVRAAADDPEVSAIALDVDSPGGSVFGIHEAAEAIYRARASKPVVAVANATAASAAYYLASQASQVIVTPSGQAGSIGVIAAHMDRSKQAEMLGVRPTFISAGRYKAEGNDLLPLDDPAREHMQRRVDQYYDAFVRAVARGRKASVQAVRDGYGEGRMLSARDAVAAGLADGVASWDRVLADLVAGKATIAAPARAEIADADLATAVMIDPLEDVAAFRARLEALAG